MIDGRVDPDLGRRCESAFRDLDAERHTRRCLIAQRLVDGRVQCRDDVVDTRLVRKNEQGDQVRVLREVYAHVQAIRDVGDITSTREVEVVCERAGVVDFVAFEFCAHVTAVRGSAVGAGHVPSRKTLLPRRPVGHLVVVQRVDCPSVAVDDGRTDQESRDAHGRSGLMASKAIPCLPEEVRGRRRVLGQDVEGAPVIGVDRSNLENR